VKNYHFVQMVAGDNIMSKKLLNETTIRRFAALSGIRADVVSNFINEEWQQTGEEAVNEEEEAEMEEKEGADEMDAEMDMMDDDESDEEAGEEEMDMDTDMDLDTEDAGEEGDAQGLVQAIVDQLQQLAQMAGVEMDVEEPEAGDMDMDLGGEEETLEEILDAILAEDAEEETLEEAEEEELEEMHCSSSKRDDEDKDKAPAKRDGSYMQEDLVQEVLKRVKARLTQLSQTQE